VHRFFRSICECHCLDLQYSSLFLESTLSQLPLSHSFLLISHRFLPSSSRAPHSPKPYSLHHLSCYRSNSSPAAVPYPLISASTPLFFNSILPSSLLILRLSQPPHPISLAIRQSSLPSTRLSNPRHLLSPARLLTSTPLLRISTKTHPISHWMHRFFHLFQYSSSSFRRFVPSDLRCSSQPNPVSPCCLLFSHAHRRDYY